MNKVYVGNLSYSVTSDQLRDLFSQAGNVVDSHVVTDRDTRRSKGFGFVEFDSAEAMAKAIEMFNDYEFEGRNLRVNEARPKAE